MVEKLLYSCSDLKEILILVRPKKGKSPESRIEEMFKIPVSNCYDVQCLCLFFLFNFCFCFVFWLCANSFLTLTKKTISINKSPKHTHTPLLNVVNCVVFVGACSFVMSLISFCPCENRLNWQKPNIDHCVLSLKAFHISQCIVDVERDTHLRSYK